MEEKVCTPVAQDDRTNVTYNFGPRKSPLPLIGIVYLVDEDARRAEGCDMLLIEAPNAEVAREYWGRLSTICECERIPIEAPDADVAS